MSGRTTFFKIANLTKEFHNSQKIINGTGLRHTAVNNVSLNIFAGEILALVGESGSGKTTFGRCLLRLVKADHGSLIYKNVDLFQLTEKQFQHYRPKFQMIFQEAVQALNPRQTVGKCLAEPLKVHCGLSKKKSLNLAQELLSSVGLNADTINRFPHELSGGQRQRVAIARALTTNPVFLVADEPTSSLDASFQRQIIELIMNLRQRLRLTLLLISHDLAMVANVSDRIAVMYQGVLVEVAPTHLLIQAPAHPYTKLLVEYAQHDIKSIPSPNQKEGLKRQMQQTETRCCAFSERCPRVETICIHEKPELEYISENRMVACHLIEQFVHINNYEEMTSHLF